jgi:hypothetical protein
MSFCITTTTTKKTATELLSDTLLHAWAAIREGERMSGEIDHSPHYDAARWAAWQDQMKAGLAVEAGIEDEAERLGVDMDDVLSAALSMCSDRELAPVE